MARSTLIAAAILLGSCGGGRAIPGTGGAGGAGGLPGSAGAGGASGSTGAGGAQPGAGGAVATDAASDAGFASDFSARAQAALSSGAPGWVCATTLPTVPVTDTASMRDAVRQFIAQVVGVAPADITMTVQPCNAAMSANKCSVTFAHDTAKSGGSIYQAVSPLADELQANATAVEETIWVPMQNGISFAADVVMSGISNGLLVGMVVFNYPSTCP
jgi:pilus assembly protein FimV